MSAAVTALACPRCSSVLPAASPAFLDCPACASPLAVFLPGEPVREAILPLVSRQGALKAARDFWKRKWVPDGFAADANLETPVLAFVPFYEIERTISGRVDGPSSVSDSVMRSPAVTVPGVPCDVDRAAKALDRAPRVPFNPVALQRLGVVFDPAGELPATPPGHVVGEATTLAWIPVWLVRCRFSRNLYEVAVDGTTGEVLAGRAPTERSARLREAIGFVYLFALLVAMPFWVWGRIFFFLLEYLEKVGFVIAVAIPPLLVTFLAYSWDRIRFRYEWVGDGRTAALVAINRPERTLVEKVRDVLLKILAVVVQVFD